MSTWLILLLAWEGSVPDIPVMVRASAWAYGVEASRAVALAWAESRLTNPVRVESNGLRSCGPLQVHELSFPGICSKPLVEQIDMGMKLFRVLIDKYGADAEEVWRFGHRRRTRK